MNRHLPALLLAALTVSLAGAQGITPARDFAAHVIVPQSRVIAVVRNERPIELAKIAVNVKIADQAATTTLDITVRNPTGSRQQAELIVPVPQGAVLHGFLFEGKAPDATAQLLPRDEARTIYDQIVARTRDPALMEFAGLQAVRTSVFPVEPNATQTLRIIYEQVLTADGQRIDYVLPRTDQLDYRVPWTIKLGIRSTQPIAGVSSPTHRLQYLQSGEHAYTVSLADEAAAVPGAFRLSYLVKTDGVATSLFAYPDDRLGGGYFLLMAAAPPLKDAPRQPKEVTLVLDHSGSMNGGKLAQAREAALQIIAGLENGDRFNVLVYNERVDRLAEAPLPRNAETEALARRYLAGLQARGGTNIHDALEAALAQPAPGSGLAMVLFLTDGLPTIGQTDEAAIRQMAAAKNHAKRRLFTFGVGTDVNVPLLDGLASESRATSTFVLPGEDVELKVAGMFRRLAGPVLTEPTLIAVDANGKPAPDRVRDIQPAVLNDFFEGDQVTIPGQYIGTEPLHFELRGSYLGEARTFAMRFPVEKASRDNGFVARLWAVRKIDTLVAAIRQLGATPATAAGDPRFKELVEEIVRLSCDFGVLTEYTAFLAREGTDLTRHDVSIEQAMNTFRDRAINARSGVGSMSQHYNHASNDWANALFVDGHIESSQPGNRDFARNGNTYLDAEMNEVRVDSMQQRNGEAYYRRGDRWVQSSLADTGKAAAPDRVVTKGSDAYRELADRLTEQGRQGSLAQDGSVVLEVDGAVVEVR